MQNENNRKLCNSNKQNIRRKWNTANDWKLSQAALLDYCYEENDGKDRGLQNIVPAWKWDKKQIIK